MKSVEGERMKEPHRGRKRTMIMGKPRQQTEAVREDKAMQILKSGASSSVRGWVGWAADKLLRWDDWSIAQVSMAPPCFMFHSSWILPSLSPSHINLICQLSLTKTYVVFLARAKANDLPSLAKARLSKPAAYWHCAMHHGTMAGSSQK